MDGPDAPSSPAGQRMSAPPSDHSRSARSYLPTCARESSRFISSGAITIRAGCSRAAAIRASTFSTMTGYAIASLACPSTTARHAAWSGSNPRSGLRPSRTAGRGRGKASSDGRVTVKPLSVCMTGRRKATRDAAFAVRTLRNSHDCEAVRWVSRHWEV